MRPALDSAASSGVLASARAEFNGAQPAAARRRSAAVIARRRSARVSVGRSPRSTTNQLKRVPRTCGRAGSLPVSRNRRGVMTSECRRRLPVEAQAWFRPTRHPVQTPARRCRGGGTSRRVDAVVSQPRSTPPSPQLDVAGTPSEGCLDDSAIPRPSGVRRQDVRGNPLRSATILNVVSGWGYTAAAWRRAATPLRPGLRPRPEPPGRRWRRRKRARPRNTGIVPRRLPAPRAEYESGLPCRGWPTPEDTSAGLGRRAVPVATSARLAESYAAARSSAAASSAPR